MTHSVKSGASDWILRQQVNISAKCPPQVHMSQYSSSWPCFWKWNRLKVGSTWRKWIIETEWASGI